MHVVNEDYHDFLAMATVYRAHNTAARLGRTKRRQMPDGAECRRERMPNGADAERRGMPDDAE